MKSFLVFLISLALLAPLGCAATRVAAVDCTKAGSCEAIGAEIDNAGSEVKQGIDQAIDMLKIVSTVIDVAISSSSPIIAKAGMLTSLAFDYFSHPQDE